MRVILCLVALFIGVICYGQECLIRCEPNIKTGAGACGTGFFISPSQVLTAGHVVENEKNVRVEFNNTYFPAKIIKYDIHKDLALLEVDCESSFYEICKYSGKINQDVICRGYPRGVWTIHKSLGKIKQIQKVLLKGAPRAKWSERYNVRMNVVHGMSGGPLLTENKKVIGVLSTKTLDSTQAHFVSLPEIKEFLK